MKKIIFILILCFAFSVSSNACLNYYYTLDKEGHLHSAGEGTDLLRPFNKNFNTELIVSKMVKLETKMKLEHSYMLLSDYSVSLLKLGKTKEALEILDELYFHYPNEYKIASNLGTAYELNGQVDSALKYIKRGLQLNPNDHGGSEWIHVRILETKLNLAKDSVWLKTHTVLQLSEKQKTDTLVQKQILIQVQERFPFCKGQDPIMASLFEDMGDISANLNSIEYAKVFYQIAKEYYGNTSESLSDKVRQMQKLSDKYSVVTAPHWGRSDGGEGENVKLGTISYKTLIGDNDLNNYQINWSKINMDVKSLLAEVNLSLTVQQARDSALKNQTEDLKLNSDSSSLKEFNEADPSAEQSPVKSKAILIILCAAIGGGLMGFVLSRIAKKRRNK